MYDPAVHLHKTVLMQRMLDAAVRGSYWYTSGKVPLDRAQRFADKLAARYGVDRNKNQRAYAHRVGRANARLFLLRVNTDTDLLWWLLATKGAGSVHEQETLYDMREKRSRLRVNDDYELVRSTRPRASGGGVVWTWRMTKECFDQWRFRLLQACSRSGRDLHMAVASLRRVPGFSGIRRQVGQLIALARREWARFNAPQDHFPEISKLGYVERLRDVVVSVSQLCGENQVLGRTRNMSKGG